MAETHATFRLRPGILGTGPLRSPSRGSRWSALRRPRGAVGAGGKKNARKKKKSKKVAEGDDYITTKELDSAMRYLGQYATETELQDMINKLDCHCDGCVHEMLAPKLGYTVEELVEALEGWCSCGCCKQ